jgi:hypothetical protein
MTPAQAALYRLLTERVADDCVPFDDRYPTSAKCSANST